MSDLTTVYHWHCKTAEQFGPITVPDESGHPRPIDHHVEFTRLGYDEERRQGVQYGWTCDCPLFKFSPGPCEHIVRVKGRRCGWSQFIDGGEIVEYVSPPGKHCPECAGPVVSMGWGV